MDGGGGGGNAVGANVWGWRGSKRLLLSSWLIGAFDFSCRIHVVFDNYLSSLIYLSISLVK